MKTRSLYDYNNRGITLTERIGERIRGVRQQKGISQSDLADKVKMSQASISQIERGCRKQVKEAVLGRIAEALDTPMDYFIVSDDEATQLPNQLPTSLCDILERIASLPEPQQEEISSAIQWLIEWRYGLPVSSEARQ